MRKLALAAIMAISALGFQANAKLKLEEDKVRHVFIDEEGHQLTAAQATLAVAADKRVMKCQEQEGKPTKNGISLRNKRD